MTAPLVSFLVDADSADATAIRLTLEALSAQTNGSWEALLVGADAGLLSDFESPQVRVVAADAQDAGVRLDVGLTHASGEYSVLLPPGSELDPAALEEVAATLGARPDADVFYTDEVLPEGRGWKTELKPAWSPERLRSVCYVGPCAGVRTSLARTVGGIQAGRDGAHSYDLVLRAVEQARAVIRVPTTVRSDHPRVADREPDPVVGGDHRLWDAHVRVVQDHLDRRVVGAKARRGPLPGTTRVLRTVDPGATVTAVIPTSGDRGLAWGEQRVFVVEAVSSLLQHAGDVQLEVVVAVAGGDRSGLAEQLSEVARGHSATVRLESVPAASRTAHVLNHVVARSDGEYLLVLQDRVEVTSPGFASELVGPLADADLGLTGPRVVTSAGVHLSAGIGIFADRFQGMHEGRLETDPGPRGELMVTREVSALLPTGWAMARAAYLEVGGLTEQLKSTGHIDLAYKLQRLGLRRVWVPTARLVHFPARVTAEAKQVWRANELDRRAVSVRWQADDLDVYAPHMGQRRLDRLAAQEQ